MDSIIRFFRFCHFYHFYHFYRKEIGYPIAQAYYLSMNRVRVKAKLPA